MRTVVSNPIEDRLAASQPDREALKEFIVSASFASRAALDSDTIFCEIYTPGYSPAKKGSFGFFVKELRAILSLLSGAGSGADTKSDGGCNCSWGCVEADNCRRKLGPLPDWKQDQSETSRIKPRPSDPSPGPVKPAPIADSSEAGTGGIVAVTQPFEKYPQLAAHIVRLANTPTAFSLNEWNDFLAALNAALSAPVGEPEGLPFGIIDPKYASFYTVARLTAWSYGYAIAMHGSFTRDLDLIAIPWTDAAVTPEELIHQIQYRTGCTPVKPNASIREHGRIVWTLSFPEFDCPRFVDFSIIPPAPAVGPDVREALEESSQTLEYLRREARTWGKIFSVNVDHVLDKNRKALSALTRPLGGFVQGSIATKQPTDPEIRSATETALTLDFVRLGVKAGLLMAAADCGNHAEGCMEDAMTSAGLAAHDKKMLDAECNAADAIQKQIKETCEDSALGYAAYMLPDEDQAALAVLGVTSDWLYRRTTGEPSRKELLDPVAPRAVADTRRAGSAGISPPEVFAAPISSVEER